MAVNLSPVGGVAAQFFTNTGAVLTGGKIYTYAAGTTTNQATYTNSTGTTAHPNPIILDAAGRVPSGEIWLTDGLQYKFVIKDSNDVLIGTYDNLIGINSNFVNFVTETEIQTATAGQTVFTLATMQYQPGTNNLSVFVDGVNQYDGVSYSYVETDSTTVTFTAGLHVGALVKFTTAQTLSTGVTDASLVVYDPPFTGSVATNVEDKLAQTVSVKDFGAVGDGVTDDTAAIQAAIDALPNGGTVYFPAGDYKTDSGITLVSNLTLQGAGGAVLKPSDSVPLWAYRGVSVNNVKIKDLTFEGTGTAFTNGNQRLLQIESGSSIEITGCTFTKAREGGVSINGCSFATVSNSNFTNCYGVGLTTRGGCSKIAVDSCLFNLNGDTGVATSTGGRGLLFWETSNSTVSNCVFEANTEYGLRLYSQSGDVTANQNIAITGCAFRDNGTTATGKIDLYVYDDAKLTERVAISGCTFSTRTGNTSAVLSGREITLSGCTFKAITPQTANGISLFGSTNVVVNGNVFHGFDNVASFSATVGSVSTNCTLSNNQCIDVLRFATLQGAGHIIANNYIKKGGAGAADEGIRAISANISATISNNTVDGFFRGFNVATTGGIVAFKDNITVNSTGTGFFAQFQTDVSGIICTNNSFDAAYPNPWATMFADSLQSFGRKFYISNATPPTGGVGAGANIVWKVGDRVFNSAPAIGSPKSWVCTVAGAPGTWTSEGNL